MKTFKNTLRIIVVLMALLTTTYSYSMNYITLTDGNWSNTTNVWSTDGVTPCGCSPGNMVNNDEVIVNHNVILSSNITVKNNSVVTVGNYATLSGSTRTLTFEGGIINLNGNTTLSKIIQTGGILNLTARTLSLSGKYELDGGVLNLNDGYLFMNGNFTILNGAEVNLTNGSYLESTNGSLSNAGDLFIGPGSCASSSGTWQNEISGTVTGTGSATSINGQMQNYNIWDPQISWCSAGADSGMTSLEDCATTGNNCNGIVLPVELIGLTAARQELNTAEITWATASESNSDYFKVMKLVVGQDWEEIDHVKAAENSTVLRDYYSMDHDYNLGDVYYRLIQVDLNGNEFYSDVVSVSFEGTGSGAYLFPNPVNSSEELTISNSSDESSVVTIIGTTSNLVMEKVNVPANKTVSFSIEKLKSGLYFVTVEQQHSTKTLKLFVTE